MKKVLFLFLQFIFSMYVFSESAFCWNVDGGGSAGWLWKSGDDSVPLYTTDIFAQIREKNMFFSVSSGYAAISSSLSAVRGNAGGGFVSTCAGTSRYAMYMGFAAGGVDDELHIADGRPRFVFEGVRGFALWTGFSCAFTDEWRASCTGYAIDADMRKGDLYYFYGKLELPRIFGGTISLSAPLGISLYGGAFFADMTVTTNENIPMGEGDAKVWFALAEKDWMLCDKHVFSLAGGYAYADFNAFVSATQQTQTYAFFPYVYANGVAQGSYHLLFLGGAYSYKKQRLSLKAILGAEICMVSKSSAYYQYQYKKTIFFDGSVGSDSFGMPDFLYSGLIGGLLDVTYRFDYCAHFVPALSVKKLFAIPLLSSELRNYFDSDSSAPVIPVDAGAGGGNGDSGSSFGWEKVWTYLLSGLSVSFRLQLH